MSDHYAYIFVRQDISPEQQLIQFGHVAAKVGALAYTDPWDKINFVGIGVKNEQELLRAMFLMHDNDIQHVYFREPDIGNQFTGVATVPISGDDRLIFSKYKSLRFPKL